MATRAVRPRQRCTHDGIAVTSLEAESLALGTPRPRYRQKSHDGTPNPTFGHPTNSDSARGTLGNGLRGGLSEAQ